MANAHQETLVDFKAVQFGSVLGMVQNIGSIPILFTNSQASSLFGGACLVKKKVYICIGNVAASEHVFFKMPTTKNCGYFLY